MGLVLQLAVFLGAVCAVLYFASSRRRNSYGLPLPPGPPPQPIIGNLLDMPRSNEPEAYRQMAEKYNTDILHLDAAGTHLIILSSAEAVEEIFEKKGAICSTRPRMPMLVELAGLDWNIGLAPYGDYHRECRGIADRELQKSAIKAYQPLQIKTTHTMLRHLLDEPEKFAGHVRHMASETIMVVTYGIEVKPTNDPFVDVAEKVVGALGEAGVPGAFLVDALPILKYVPEWFPGAGFQKKGKQWRALGQELLKEPFKLVKRHMAQGTAIASLTSSALDKLPESTDKVHEEKVVEAAMASMYLATVDSLDIATLNFILAMLLYPEVQAKAHEELDRVVGPGLLPDFSHEDQLPYINAIVKESLRWYPLAPLAIPHLLTEETMYKGYCLPVNSVIMGNTWALCREEAVYKSPAQFDPTRYLPPVNAPDPIHSFGYGRRMCPGRFMAHSCLLISFASILATFDIGMALDEHGNPIKPHVEYKSGLAMSPSAFKCSITPRSEKIAAQLRNTA